MDIPEPKNSGSSGTQQPSIVETVDDSLISPFEGLPIQRAVEGVASSRTRSMGGEAAAGLLVGSFNQLAYDLQQTKEDLSRLRNEFTKSQSSLLDCKVQNATLGERLRSVSRTKHLRNLSITAGTVLIGVGIEFYRSNLDRFAFIVGLIGALLLFLGWFSLPGESKK